MLTVDTNTTESQNHVGWKEPLEVTTQSKLSLRAGQSKSGNWASCSPLLSISEDALHNLSVQPVAEFYHSQGDFFSPLSLIGIFHVATCLHGLLSFHYVPV